MQELMTKEEWDELMAEIDKELQEDKSNGDD